MFLLMLTRFIPLSRDRPTLEILFLANTALLAFLAFPLSVLEWRTRLKNAAALAQKEKEEK